MNLAIVAAEVMAIHFLKIDALHGRPGLGLAIDGSELEGASRLRAALRCEN
jgi:hypothetical protein